MKESEMLKTITIHHFLSYEIVFQLIKNNKNWPYPIEKCIIKKVVTLFIMDFPWKFEAHTMCTLFFFKEKVTSTIPRNTQKKNVERQESGNIARLSNTQKSNTYTEIYIIYII